MGGGHVTMNSMWRPKLVRASVSSYHDVHYASHHQRWSRQTEHHVVASISPRLYVVLKSRVYTYDLIGSDYFTMNSRWPAPTGPCPYFWNGMYNDIIRDDHVTINSKRPAPTGPRLCVVLKWQYDDVIRGDDVSMNSEWGPTLAHVSVSFWNPTYNDVIGGVTSDNVLFDPGSPCRL